MSRIGLKKILIPKDVNISIDDAMRIVKINGKYGAINVNFPKNIICSVDNDSLFVKRIGNLPKKEDRKAREMHGTIRAIINNAVIGVSKLFKKELELIGSGYRVEKKGENLNLFAGFSDPVIIKPPEGIKMDCQDNKIIITGVQKQLVGDQAAKIRKIRIPNVYTENGIRYVGEKINKRKRKGADTSVSSTAKNKKVKK